MAIILSLMMGILCWCLLGVVSMRLVLSLNPSEELRKESVALGCLFGALVIPMYLLGMVLDMVLGLKSLKNNGKNSQSKKPKFKRKTKTM